MWAKNRWNIAEAVLVIGSLATVFPARGTAREVSCNFCVAICLAVQSLQHHRGESCKTHSTFSGLASVCS